jgi:hypothetical protein
MDNNEYSKIIEESFNKISYQYVEKLLEKGTVDCVYAVNVGEPKTDKHKRLLEVANDIVYGGYDGYIYNKDSYTKVIDFWENVEKELKEILNGE